MRVLVTGGRNYADYDMVKFTLDRLTITTLIHGGCRGVDMLANRWACDNNIETVAFVPDWDTYGPSAGPRRNYEMVHKGKPDLVVAFPGGKGTANCVKTAKEAGVQVLEIK